MKPTIVVSAPNLVEGGPLSVLRDCASVLASMTDRVSPVIVLNSASLIPDYPGVAKIVHSAAKKSWSRRMRYEFFEAEEVSRSVKADIWLSLHDITSRVSTPAKFVYCHNPSPFYRLSIREAFLEPKLALFSAFYDRLYSLGIRSNDAVIVQQEWLREEFNARFRPKRVVTAWPHVIPPKAASASLAGKKRIFLYPAFPRVFKNFEVISEAAKLLASGEPFDGEIRLTIDGSENRYATTIAKSVEGNPLVKLIGLQDRDAMRAQYHQADVVLFPSKLETWGLPISEAKALGKTILLADRPYAHETLGEYNGAVFLDPERPDLWADAMRQASNGVLDADDPNQAPTQPDFRTWSELIEFILGFAPGKQTGCGGYMKNG